MIFDDDYDDDYDDEYDAPTGNTRNLGRSAKKSKKEENQMIMCRISLICKFERQMKDTG